jgi:hypothetical protein
VKPQIRGEAQWWRFADDGVCAFRFKEDAERVYRELPKRLKKFGLEIAPEKTRIVRFSRFDPGKERRFAFLGFEFYWEPDRKGVPRVKRRTARKKLRVACQRIKEWIRTNRHQPGRDFLALWYLPWSPKAGARDDIASAARHFVVLPTGFQCSHLEMLGAIRVPA